MSGESECTNTIHKKRHIFDNFPLPRSQQQSRVSTTATILPFLLSARAEENLAHLRVRELVSAHRALAIACANHVIDALFAKEVEAAREAHSFEAVLTDGAAKHAQRHFKHGRVGTAERAASLDLDLLRFGLGLALGLHSEGKVGNQGES